ncbi:mRNA surveillance protein pelota [Candidatus Woesearchaeota archaeon]|nr:mRNA surveillance protein pelota [Candidatus Woesearchaeota archaeon]
MKIIRKDVKHGIVSVKVQTPDDLWYLSQIISPGDIATALTERKIRIGGKEESGSVVKKTVKLSVAAEKVEFIGTSLRVSGKITSGPEDIPKGSYHTITIEANSLLTIEKEKWSNYELARLKEASEQGRQSVLIVVFDREQALFAILKAQGYEVLSEIKGDVQKKGFDSKAGNFYGEIISLIKDYSERYKAERIVLASPAFWKEELMKELKDKELSPKIVQASCSYVGKNAIDEVLKRPELNSVLKEGRAAKEAQYVDEVMEEIGKKGLVTYGPKQVKEAIELGAVSKLFVTTSAISESRQSEKFAELESVMKKAESMKGEVIIINSENDAGQRLDGLGGLAALLRYKTDY